MGVVVSLVSVTVVMFGGVSLVRFTWNLELNEQRMGEPELFLFCIFFRPIFQLMRKMSVFFCWVWFSALNIVKNTFCQQYHVNNRQNLHKSHNKNTTIQQR